MRFVHPLFLIGTLAALIPVIIHLLTRDRIRKVEFSTLRFFARNSQRVLRRKRYQEVLLLLMRMAICFLLAIVFAQPFFSNQTKQGQASSIRTARVIVADVSGSIGRAPEGEFKAAIQRSLNELTEGTDAVALVTFTDTATVESGLSPKFDDVQVKIKGIAPGQGGTNIPAALQAADQLLKNTAATNREIVLMSDLQRTGWMPRTRSTPNGDRLDGKLSANVKLIVQSLAPSGGVLPHADVAIVDRYCPQSVVLDQTPQPISIKIKNLSQQQLSDLPVTLNVLNKSVATQKVNIRPGATMLVQFTHVFERPGDNPVTVHAGTSETFTPENTAWFNARVIGKIPVVILNGSPSTNRALDPAFFLNLALSPKQSPPFDVRVIDAAAAVPADIHSAAVVFLADADKLKTGMNQALVDLLQRGGGIMFLPGAKVSANIFNEQFAGTDRLSDLAPCRLKTVLETPPVPGEVGGISLSKIDFDHPIFRIFALPHHGDFSTVRFFRWWEVRDYQGAVTVAGKEAPDQERPRILARFEDGRPAILDRQIGRGVSMLLAASTDLRWTNFPEKAAVFQPFMHLTAKYLSIRTEPRTVYSVGELLPIPAGTQLTDPQGKRFTDQERVGQSAGILARQAGFYTLAAISGEPRFCYAVNADPAEFDTATIAANEIIAAVQRSPEESTAIAAANEPGATGKDTSHIWWYVTLALMALFTVEVFVANRTLRH
jgi:hypothetical protein